MSKEVETFAVVDGAQFIGENNKTFFNETVHFFGYPAFPPQLTALETRLRDVNYALENFGVPTILTVGIISNVILSITVRNTELKKVAICCYFFSMAIVDTIYLIAMAIPWASARLVDIYNRDGFCQLVYYLNLLTTFLSSWYVVMMLFERMAISLFPDRMGNVCNAFRTKCYITTVSIFSVVGHLYLTWTSGIYYIRQTPTCMVIPENMKDIMIVRKIDIVFSFILPILMCSLLAICILIHLCAFYLRCKRGRPLSLTAERMSFEVRIHAPQIRMYTNPLTNDTAVANNQKIRRREFAKSKRLTIVAMVIALVYIALCLPHNIIKSKITFMNGPYRYTNLDRLLLRLFEDLYKINFAYKGLIYFTLIPEMRIHLVRLCFSWSKFICRSTRNNKNEVSKV